MESIKRVLSKNCDVDNMREEKKSKNDEQPPMLTEEENARAMLTDEEDTREVGGNGGEVSAGGFPVGTIHQSRASTTHSSLSSEAEEDDDKLTTHGGDEKAPPSLAPSPPRGGHRSPSQAWAQATLDNIKRTTMTRQVSRDISISSSMGGSRERGGTVGSVGANWGWFEDVGHHGAGSEGFLPGGNNRDDSLNRNLKYGSNDSRGRTTGGHRGKGGGGGLLQMGSDLLGGVYKAIVEPQQVEFLSSFGFPSPRYLSDCVFVGGDRGGDIFGHLMWGDESGHFALLGAM